VAGFVASWRSFFELPMVKAFVWLAAPIGIAFFVNSRLPDDVIIDLHNPGNSIVVLLAVLSVYFYTCAVIAGEQTEQQRKLRAIEQAFHYDKRGTLYNGDEPMIALRVATFRGVLDGMAEDLGMEEVREALVKTGRLASVNFAAFLPSIYERDVRGLKGGESWNDLSFHKKLFEWCDYDSAGGWGIFECDAQDTGIRVFISHRRGLIEGRAGALFASFLAGYCETVLTQIMATHRRGKFADFSKAVLKAVKVQNVESVELSYEWA
jgi:hypothetical protein